MAIQQIDWQAGNGWYLQTRLRGSVDYFILYYIYCIGCIMFAKFISSLQWVLLFKKTRLFLWKIQEIYYFGSNYNLGLIFWIEAPFVIIFGLLPIILVWPGFFFFETETKTSLLIKTLSTRDLYKEKNREEKERGNL